MLGEIKIDRCYYKKTSKNINISFITHTKKRVELLKQCCDSIWGGTENNFDIEHIIMYDKGDSPTEKFLHDYQASNKDKNMSFYSVACQDYNQRSLIRDYVNVGCNIATGNYLIGMPDDGKIVTEDYDTIIMDSIEEYLINKPDRICYMLVNDDSKSHVGNGLSPVGENKYCAFPIITKELRNCIGGMFPKELVSQGADTTLYSVMSSLNYDRILDIRNNTNTIDIEHWSCYTGRLESEDETHAELPKHGQNSLSEQQMNKYTTTINNYIKDTQTN